MINKLKYHLLPARLKTRWSFYDYLYFRMQEKSRVEIEEFLTQEELIVIEKYLNNDSLRNVFNSKKLFYKHFKPLMGRELIDLCTTSQEAFMTLLKAKKRLILKPDNLYAGLGIYIVTFKDDSLVSQPDQLPEYSILQSQNYVAEEYINQHPSYATVYDGCLNTIRVTTFLDKYSTAHILFAANQFGSKGSIVDNNDETSIWAVINLDTGVAEYPDIDETSGLIFHNHPDTGTDIIGFQNPLFDKIKELSLKAALIVPECRLIGWDIAVTDENDVILIEGNVTPELDLYRRITGRDLHMLKHVLSEFILR